MLRKIQSKSIACTTLALLGFAATGCSTSGTQAVEPTQPEPTEYVGLAIYDHQPPQMFSLVAADSIGLVAFADTMVAWSLEDDFLAEHDSLAVAE